jgi:ABC-type lipoprotein release transport system permease subunit
MTGFVASALRNRPWRAGTLAVGILAAAVSFVLLTGSARTSSIQVRGTVTRNFRGAYDILVRPAGSFTPLEREQALVRDNYLSGIYGGITLRQYRTVARLPGVDVAAPIANVGTVLARSFVSMRMQPFVGPARDQLFRVRFNWVAQRGLSRYPGADEYVYVTRRPLVASSFGTERVGVTDPATGATDPVCEGFDARPAVLEPFRPVNSTFFWCASTDTRAVARTLRELREPLDAKDAVAFFEFMFPVNVAAVDPAAEARLVGLDRALVSGRYLKADDRPRLLPDPSFDHVLSIPALEASRTFVDEQLTANVERLVIPPRTNVPGMLAAGACPGPTVSCDPSKQWPGPRGHRRATAYGFVRRLKGIPIASRTFSARAVYAHALRRPGYHVASLQHVTVDAFWTGEPVRYRRLGTDELAPRPQTNDETVWFSSLFGSDSGYFDQPTDNLDTQFRKLRETPGISREVGGQLLIPDLDSIGRFDPGKLAGFSRLSHVPLETYYPPSLTPADARTSRLLRGRALAPDQNVGEYVQQPPLLLTNLAALRPLLSSARFDNVSPRQQRAPISVIRVRVAGVTGPDKLSQARIKTVAQLIHDRTGLAVDVTAGSSPTPLTIDLPAGKFGRPPLELSEGWVKKGVAVAYLRALDRKDVALFALVLVVCCFFLANGTLAGVRARRAEIGTLRTLGWPGQAIFAAVLGELLLVALTAGLAGAGLAALLVRLLALDFPLARVLFVVPLAVLLALLAGSGPAWTATRGEPLDALRPPVAPGRRGHARGLASLALVNLRRLPLRTVLGAGGLALGVAALTVLLAIERAFRGVLVGTLLGNTVSLQVRGADLVAAAITIGLAALAVADVLYLNLRERAPELAALRTTGWAEGHVARLVVLEGLGLGLLGSAAGLVVGLLVGALVLGVPVAPLLAAAGIAAAAGTAAALVAAAFPTAAALRTEPSVVLAAD